MRSRLYLIAVAIILGLSLVFSWKAENVKIGPDNSLGPHLSTREVLRIAEKSAKERGINLTEFHPPEPYFQYTRKDQSWTVFFHSKTMATDSAFFIEVDDQTSEARFVEGG